MAGDIVAFAVQTLGNLLVEEAKFLNGVGEQVKQLQDELRRLKCFLKDAEVKQHDDTEMIRNWRLEIRDAAYDAEDCLESFLLKQKHSDLGRNGLKTILRRLACFLDEAAALHKTGSEVEEITTRLSKIATSMRDLNVQEPIDTEASLSSETHKREKRETFAHVAERNLVGIDETVEKLAGDLVDGSKKKQFRVLSICGMGGLGKSTHAKQIFHHNSVRRHFERFAWIYVSQNCRRRHVWQEMFLNLSYKSEKQRILDMRDQELAEELHQFLKTNKCLVVLDDIWSTEAWDLVSPVFPHDTDSQMILTSRIKDVATYADPRGILYEPSYLNDDESWELLCKVAFSEQDIAEPVVNEKMEELGKQMVKRCGGLPLGITVLGGLLATKSTMKEWQSVHSRMKSVIAESSHHKQNNPPVLEVLALSFEYLPPHLKQCFLYFAHFPQGYHVPVGRLRSYWAAEGMVVPSHIGEDATMEDVADSYLEELVKRSMVLSDTKDVNLEYFRTYHLHDLMRDVCLRQAQEEKFVRIINLRVQDGSTNDSILSSTDTSRRLAVHLGDSPLDFDRNAILQKQIKLSKSRSLVFIVNIHKNKWVLSGAIPFKDLSCLRVLELSKAQFQGGVLPNSVGNLIHLRYLCLRNSNLIKLPSSIGNLKLMQNLDLYVEDGPVYIPNVLWKMQSLRHLRFPLALAATTKLDLGSLTQLQTLWDFHVENCNLKDLMYMMGLRRLSICFSSASLDLTEITLLSTVLNHLRGVGVNHRGEPLLLPPVVDVTQMVSAFVDLSELELFIKIKKLPEQHMFPRNLLILRLSSCELEQDPFTVLEKLPYLRILRLSSKTFVGTKLVCSEKGFPQLRSLSILDQENLEEWIVGEDAMPFLKFLEVKCCRRLKMLPDGLRFVETLREVEIIDMSKSFKENLVPGGEHFYRIQHVPSVMFDNCEVYGI